jgi:hypothetical protein
MSVRSLLIGSGGLLALSVACASPKSATPDNSFVGSWSMVSRMEDSDVRATMVLARSEDGALEGNWVSRGREMPLESIVRTGNVIEFDRAIPGGELLHFSGSCSGEAIEGSWTGAFGEIQVSGLRGQRGQPTVTDAGPEDLHTRPIIEEDGLTLLWASDDGDWFDVTDATIDPTTFQFGIGRDTIPSVDAPVFVAFDDARVAAADITRETSVLGIELEGEARAYPVELMDMHEIVNDQFADKSYAVMW